MSTLRHFQPAERAPTSAVQAIAHLGWSSNMESCIQALQKGRYQVLSAGENRIRRVAALVLGSASVALLVFAGRSMGLFYSGFAMAVLALLLLSPTGALWLTQRVAA